MMRELVKEAAGMGIAQAIEQDGWFNMEEWKEDGLLDTPSTCYAQKTIAFHLDFSPEIVK